ncbi:MAG: helix-turn-helix transcriptional regulator [Pseudomonadota bacterium]
MPDSPVLSSGEIDRPLTPLFEAEVFDGPVTFVPVVIETHTLMIPLHTASLSMRTFRDGQWENQISGPPNVHLGQIGERTGWQWPAGARVMRLRLDLTELQRFVVGEMRMIASDSRLKGLAALQDEKICRAAAMIEEVLGDQRPGQAVLYDALARMLVVHVVRSYIVARDAVLPGAMSPESYTQIIAHIDAKIAEPIRIADLCEIAHMSESAFLRAIKSATGRTPHELVRSRRLDAARRLLQLGELSISQIASETGFSDQAHLSRSFKQAFGQSPRQWRRGQ